MRWVRSLSPDSRKILGEILGTAITLKNIDSIGSMVSLFWTDEYPNEASGYASSGQPTLVIDPHKIPSLLGFFEADEAGRKGEVVLVLLCDGKQQAPPSCVVDVIEPKG